MGETTNLSIEEVMELWSDTIIRRDKCMLEKIEKYNPSIIIIGDVHAQNLREKLSEYEYKTFY